MQLIRLSPELGRALGDGDCSRRLINFKGSITACHRREMCPAALNKATRWRRVPYVPQMLSHSSLPYYHLCLANKETESQRR